MKKLLLLLMFSIVLMGVVSAVNECGTSGTYFGSTQPNTIIHPTQICASCTFVNLSSITYPNGTTTIYGTGMTENGITYNTTFNVPDLFGCYSYSVLGDPSGTNTAETLYFLVGSELTTGRAISYIGFIVILILTLSITIFGATKVRWKHLRNDEDKILTINNFRYFKVTLFALAYFEMMFLFGLSYKFFNEANIEGFTSFFNFVYQLFLNLMYPLIVFLIIVFFIIWVNNIKLKEKLKLGL